MVGWTSACGAPVGGAGAGRPVAIDAAVTEECEEIGVGGSSQSSALGGRVEGGDGGNQESGRGKGCRGVGAGLLPDLDPCCGRAVEIRGVHQHEPESLKQPTGMVGSGSGSGCSGGSGSPPLARAPLGVVGVGRGRRGTPLGRCQVSRSRRAPLGRLCGGCLSPNGTRHMRAPDLHPAWGGGTSVWAAVLGPGAHRVPRMGRKHISSAAWNPLGQAFQPEPCTAVRCPWTPGCSTFLPSETRDGPVTG